MLDSRPTVRERLARRLAASAACREGGEECRRRLDDARSRCSLRVERIPLDGLARWTSARASGDLVHESGRFFAVRGLDVRTTYGRVPAWSQPIIHQPEEGILGFLVSERNGILHFLVQLKAEPGNAGVVQLSPTVQATPSNYLRVHRGGDVPYLDYFTGRRSARVLVDVPQSENGSWFLGKRNRNMLVETDDDVEHDEAFAWLTLGQIHELLRRPNTVNMDARTVLSCLQLPELDERGAQCAAWLAAGRTRYRLGAHLAPLSALRGWRRDDDEIAHESGRYFRIVGVAVDGARREVGSWCQPLLEPAGEGLVAFAARRIAGELHVLARLDVRPGYRQTVEIGPTVQCTPANFADAPARRPEFLDLVLSGEAAVLYDVAHSEEGGRFHHAVTRHLIVEVDDRLDVRTAPDYFWIAPSQLRAQLRESCRVNIEARSLLACLDSLG